MVRAVRPNAMHECRNLLLMASIFAAARGSAIGQEPQGSGARPSPDSSKTVLVFSALVEQQWELFAWNPGTSVEPTRLTETPEDELRPSLAGDRRSVAYETTDGRLHRMDLNTRHSDALPFASDQHFDMQPSVSPDGRAVLLATSLSRKLDDTNVAIIQTSGEESVRQLHFPSSQFAPCWAPDGIHFAFINLQASGWVGRVTTEIWFASLEPPTARQLTMLDSLSVDPSWTPDGKRVLFSSNAEGQYEIYSVDVGSREVKRLTNHPAADTDPVSSPDGGAVLFVSTRGGNLGLWLLRGDDSNAVELKPFGDKQIRCKDPDWR